MQPANAIVGALRDAAQPLRGSNADYDALLEYNGESQSGKFPVDYKHDTEQQILERAEFMWKSPEQTREAQLVDQVFDAAKSGMRGVLGIESTLSALAEEKVRTLVIADSLTINGSVCTRCDYFLLKNSKSARSAAEMRNREMLQTEQSNELFSQERIRKS
jgi:hypothetical protein